MAMSLWAKIWYGYVLLKLFVCCGGSSSSIGSSGRGELRWLDERLRSRQVFPSLLLAVLPDWHLDHITNQTSTTLVQHTRRLLDSLHWVAGPFTTQTLLVSRSDLMTWMHSHEHDLHPTACLTNHFMIPNHDVDTLSLFIFDDPHDEFVCEEIPSFLLKAPLRLKDFWQDRYRIQVRFQLPNTYPHSVEMKWAHFRGNLNLVDLSGDEKQAVLLHPGDTLTQYTNAGHLFVLLAPKASLTNGTCSTEYGQIVEEERILSLQLVPAVSTDPETHFYSMVIDPTKSANIHLLQSKTKQQSYFNTARPMESLLLTYWEHQRKCQIHLNSWALPSLQVVASSLLGESQHRQQSEQFEEETITTNHLWRKVSLPAKMAEKFKYQFLNVKETQGQQESFISMVFNQHAIPTDFVPSPSSGLKLLEIEVLREAFNWFGIQVRDWMVSSSYGYRVYRKDAVIRWHVDPTETQPLTAIIHIAHSDDQQQPWMFHVPKTLRGIQEDLDEDNLEAIELQEGEMLLIQSAKLPHARLLPLQQDFYANVFVHLAPEGWIDRPEVRSLM